MVHFSIAGKFHSEYDGEGFIGLSSKSYYCKGDKDKFSAKGVNRRTNKIGFDHFKAVLTSRSSHRVRNSGFKFVNHTAFTYNQGKTGLGYFYGKRVVGADGISTYPTEL